jgi:hypothetical protein
MARLSGPGTQYPTPNTSSRPTLTAFLLGAIAGGVLAGALGGVLGAGLALLTLAIARAPWPVPLRAVLGFVILVGGFGTLWAGAGFVRTVLGLIAAGRPGS